MKSSVLASIAPAINTLLKHCGVKPIQVAYDVPTLLERLAPAIAEVGEKRRARLESKAFANPGLCVSVDGQTYETNPLPRRGRPGRQTTLSSRGGRRTTHDAFRRQFELGGYSPTESSRMAERDLR